MFFTFAEIESNCTMKLSVLPLLLFTFFYSKTIAAQEIAGTVNDEQNEPVAFAAVLLFNANDTTLHSSTLTDTSGFFQFTLSNPNIFYFIEVQTLGKKNFKSATFQGNHQFETITLKNDVNELGAVRILNKKPLYEKTGRGMIVNVSESPVLEGSNTKEVLEKIPGVSVGIDGNISLKGKSNLQIFMDGKPTNMSIEDLMRLLETMPATEIEKIEVFEIPPAKFDAAGGGGIINLVTKKGMRLGFNGNIGLRTGYGNYHKFTPWANGNYRSSKINAFGSTWYYNQMFDHKATADMKMNINGDTSSFFNRFHRIHHGIGYGGRYGLDYFVNNKTTIGYLGVLYNGNTFGWEPSTITVNGPASSAYDFIDAIENFDYFYSGHTHNLNLSHEIKENESINLDVDIALRKNGRDNNNLNEYFLKDSALTPYYIEQLGNSNSTIAATALDYEKTVLNWELETGVKGSYVKTNNDFSAFNGTNSEDAIENVGLSNRFVYEEAIGAAYLSGIKKWKERWTLDAGFRAEYTLAKGTSPTIVSSFQKNYINFFPNLSLSYSKPKKYSLSSAYTRRIKRPEYHQLNPFQSQTNQFNFHEGNPDLNPAYTDVLNITYGLLDAFYLTLSANQTHGLMNRVIMQEETAQRQVYTIQNLDKFENYSINAFIPWKIKKWYQGHINGTYYYNKMASSLKWGTVGYELNTFRISMQHIFTLPKDISLELSGFYNHDSYWNIWFVEPHYKLDFGASKKFKNWKININFADFLNVREGNGGVFQDNVNMATTYKPESRKVILNIRYRFGNQKVKEARKRKTASEELQKRAGE